MYHTTSSTPLWLVENINPLGAFGPASLGLLEAAGLAEAVGQETGPGGERAAQPHLAVGQLSSGLLHVWDMV